MAQLSVDEAVDQIVGILCTLGHLPDNTQERSSEDQELLSQNYGTLAT